VHVWLQDLILADSNLSPANVIMSQINNNNNKSSYFINERFSHANADFFKVMFSEMTTNFYCNFNFKHYFLQIVAIC
jgi:hypothetical protein